MGLINKFLGSEAMSMKAQVEAFSNKFMRPAGVELDNQSSSVSIFGAYSVFWEVGRKYRGLGLHLLGIGAELGGLSESLEADVAPILAEELGYGDAGLAVGLAVSDTPYILASKSREPVLQQLAMQYANDMKMEFIGCHLLDSVDEGTGADAFHAPATAFLEDAGYLINSGERRWVINAGIATHAAVKVEITGVDNKKKPGLAIVPLNLPGVHRLPSSEKLGQRSLNEGSLQFENVLIPSTFILPDHSEELLSGLRLCLSGINVGLGRAAYEEALNYSKQRVQGGIPIFEHKNIKLKLFSAFAKLEAARSLFRQTAQIRSANARAASNHAIAAKVFSAQAAFEAAHHAVTIFGANGLAREYIIEKLLRDAEAAMLLEGEVDRLSIFGASSF